MHVVSAHSNALQMHDVMRGKYAWPCLAKYGSKFIRMTIAVCKR